MSACDTNYRMEAAKRAQQLARTGKYAVTGEALSRRIVSFLHTIRAYDVGPGTVPDSGLDATKIRSSYSRKPRGNYGKLSSDHARS